MSTEISSLFRMKNCSGGLTSGTYQVHNHDAKLTHHLRRLTQMVNFCHNVAANLYNPSRCPVDLVSPSRWVGKPGTFYITPKAKDDLPFAGLVSFIFVENSQLKTISQFTNDDGEVKGNTSLTGVLITCEGQRALAFLAHHSHQQSEEVGVYNNAQGLMVWSTARSQLKVPGLSLLCSNIVHSNKRYTSCSPQQDEKGIHCPAEQVFGPGQCIVGEDRLPHALGISNRFVALNITDVRYH